MLMIMKGKATPTARMRTMRGFTVLEAVVTVALMAIILTIGVPWLGNFVQDNRMATQVNSMKTALNLARSEALKRGAPVTLCPTEDATASEPSCTTSGWEVDWVVFVDSESAGAGSASPDGADGVIRVWQRDGDAAGLATSPGVRFARYLPDGTLDVAHFTSNGDDPEACDNEGEFACFIFTLDGTSGCRGDRRLDRRELTLTRTGRAATNNLECPS